jgi:CRP/FNR family transcriptional regulator, cyclic AMP receptor protein
VSGSRKIEKDHYLFREGDASDAIFVVKSGKFAITKAKQNSEIILAEVGPGAMVSKRTNLICSLPTRLQNSHRF